MNDACCEGDTLGRGAVRGATVGMLYGGGGAVRPRTGEGAENGMQRRSPSGGAAVQQQQQQQQQRA